MIGNVGWMGRRGEREGWMTMVGKSHVGDTPSLCSDFSCGGAEWQDDRVSERCACFGGFVVASRTFFCYFLSTKQPLSLCRAWFVGQWAGTG